MTTGRRTLCNETSTFRVPTRSALRHSKTEIFNKLSQRNQRDDRLHGKLALDNTATGHDEYEGRRTHPEQRGTQALMKGTHYCKDGLEDKTNGRGTSCYDPTLMVATTGLPGKRHPVEPRMIRPIGSKSCQVDTTAHDSSRPQSTRSRTTSPSTAGYISSIRTLI
jgi:hypothetical protein